MASYTRGTSEHMSMREKGQLKRRINKEHNSNFRAGYVHIDEEQLHKTGIRGRKIYFFYMVIFLLFLAIIVNILITVVLLSVLRIDRHGMKSMEFVGPLLRFTEDADMGDVNLYESTVGGLADRDLVLSAPHKSKIQLHAGIYNGSTMLIQSEHTKISSEQGFTVIDPATGGAIFSTNFTERSQFPKNVSTLDVKRVVTSRITSGIDEDLTIETGGSVLLRGSEGASFDGKTVSVRGRDNVNLTTKETLEMDSVTGRMFLDQFRYLAISSQQDNAVKTFKLCVCANSGQLFLVPAPYTCHQANEDEDPCSV
ncbi:Beta-sarcoglycan [Lamellibrachia satsuma]|nr:Beta-sarcoglycan [Lamellibrachia satsuma]